MRIAVALIVNLLLLVRALLGLPFRWMKGRGRPKYVRFALRGDPPYRELVRRRWRMFSRRDPAEVISLAVLREQLARLSADPRVRGAVFLVDRLNISAAKADAIAACFAVLRGAGKEVVGYALHAGNAEYEVLCAADRIILAPAGRLDLTGFAAGATALGSALSRLGISAQFVRRGDYKTAPEMFTDAEISEIHRQTVEHLLDLRFDALLSKIARGRRISAEEARRRVDRGPYSAKRALAAGLCDGLCQEADLGSFLEGRPAGNGAALAARAGDDSTAEAPLSDRPSAHASARAQDASAPAPSAPFASGAPAAAGRGSAGRARSSPAKDDEPSERRLPDFASYCSSLTFPPIPFRPLKRRTRLSIVPLNGIIAEGEGGRAPVGPEIAGSEGVAGAIRAARSDRRTAAILFYVNSPGGSAIASELILDEVRRAAQKKPVVAYFDRVAASGGYMAALGADEIWAAPDAIAGSIGVFGGKFELSRLLERLGVRRALLTRGENAGLFSVSRPFTERERRALEVEIEEAYQDFLEQVSRSRGKSKNEIHARGQGRIYSGDEALEAELIDCTGSFEDACRRALELAKKPTEGFDVAIHPAGKRRIPLVRLMREAQRTGVFALWLPGLESLEWEGAQ